MMTIRTLMTNAALAGTNPLKLSLPLTGLEGSTTFTDLASHTIQVNAGAPYITLAQAVPEYGSSLYLNGASGLKSADSADWILPKYFMLEWYLMLADLPGVGDVLPIIGQYESVARLWASTITNTAGEMRFKFQALYDGGPEEIEEYVDITDLLQADEWNHFRIIRLNDTLYLSVNHCNLAKETVASSVLSNLAALLEIGGLAGPNLWTTGWLSHLHLDCHANL